jgi:hypothetical protein
MLPDSDTQLLQVREDSNKMKKAHKERMLSMAFQFHNMVSNGIYVTVLGDTLSI